MCAYMPPVSYLWGDRRENRRDCYVCLVSKKAMDSQPRKKKPFWLKHHSPFWFIALEKWEQLWHIPLLLCASSERSHTEKPGAVHRKQNIIHRSNCFLLMQLKPTDCKRLSFWYKTQIESVMLFPHKYSTVLFSLLFKSSSCRCLGLLQKSEHERRFLVSNSFWE